MEMSPDPFLEAGIDIPNELPNPPPSRTDRSPLTHRASSRTQTNALNIGDNASCKSSARNTPTLLRQNVKAVDSINNSLLKRTQDLTKASPDTEELKGVIVDPNTAKPPSVPKTVVGENES